jgi:DNA modification methylase
VKYPRGTTEHPINKSKNEKILVSVWDFGPVHPQTERSYYKCNDHPAKMHPSLARALLKLYGESPVLDPMAGIGTTLVEAMLLGLNAIGVEYEKRFVGQANENIKNVEEKHQDKKLGRAMCVKGDARDLSFLEERFCGVLFSPPYFDALSVNKGGGSRASIRYEETTPDLQMKRSGPFAVKKNLPTPYSSSKGNIGNLGRFGSIVFSPPLGEANAGSGIAKRGYQGRYGTDERLKDRCDRPLSQDSKNISNVRYGRTYLSEMLKVYRECYRVLKPGKFMVVVVRDIQRNWKTIPLCADTIKLCQLAGFDCHDVIINKIYFPSFWMLSLAKNSQREGVKRSVKFHALKSHEYVLVFRKPLDC